MGKVQSKSTNSNTTAGTKRSKNTLTYLLRRHTIEPESPTPPKLAEEKVEKDPPKKIDLANYMFPVSENEVDLMHARHYLNRHIWGNNFSAPVGKLLRKQGTRVLDVGCGPGIWILENASEYETAKFTGVDLATLYPREIKPSNTEFFACNILNGLPFEDDTFDFVFMRFMLFGLTFNDWEKKVIPELVRVTKPGGWVELMEMDVVWYNEGPITSSLRSAVIDALRNKCGIEPVISSHIPTLLQATEQAPTVYQDEKMSPIGSWGGDVGRINSEVLKWGAKCLADLVAADLGLSSSEYLSLVDGGFKEMDTFKSSTITHRFWAMKTQVGDGGLGF